MSAFTEQLSGATAKIKRAKLCHTGGIGGNRFLENRERLRADSSCGRSPPGDISNEQPVTFELLCEA